MRFLFLFLIPVFTLHGSPDPGLTELEKKTVESGNIAVRLERDESSTTGKFLIVGYVNAPVDDIWTLITTKARHSELYPEVKKHEITDINGNVEEHYYVFDYPWPFDDRWLVTHLIKDKSKYQITWVRKDGTIKESKGSWSFISVGPKKTLIVYRVQIDPGISVLPDWFIRWGTGYAAPKVILRIREVLKAN